MLHKKCSLKIYFITFTFLSLSVYKSSHFPYFYVRHFLSNVQYIRRLNKIVMGNLSVL